MNRIGLVLGGGGVTGAAYQMATLMAIELATGWSANQAEVVVGTSGGAYVTSIVRNDRLVLDSLVRREEDSDAVAERIRNHVFVKDRGARVGQWVRHGLVPGLRRPGLTMLMGSPAGYDASGLAGWVREQVGPEAEGWPSKATVITAYDVRGRHRVAFGTVDAPDVSLADAVAASSAIPLVFHPYAIDGRTYVDGGVASGTHADLLLGASEPLDFVLVIAPMAATEGRDGAWFHERLFDRVGCSALDTELALLAKAWPKAEQLVLRPVPQVLAAMRPNPMASDRAVPTFVRTLSSMKRRLASPEIWPILDRHLRRQRVGRAG
ncbi:hypothetical protein BH23ACT5_BH23ACT5_20950 [soil metagenome]